VLKLRSKLNTQMKCKSQTRCQNRRQLPYSGDALRWDLIRLRDVWRESRRQHDRFSIFKYLAAVYDLVSVWKKENKDIERAKRALRLKNRAYGNTIEPFAAIISCTSSRKAVNGKVRSKWAHVLMFAAKYKSPGEPLEEFIRRHGGINSCTAELSRLKPKPSPASIAGHASFAAVRGGKWCH
jgi:hypothetical protein